VKPLQWLDCCERNSSAKVDLPLIALSCLDVHAPFVWVCSLVVGISAVCVAPRALDSDWPLGLRRKRHLWSQGTFCRPWPTMCSNVFSFVSILWLSSRLQSCHLTLVNTSRSKSWQDCLDTLWFDWTPIWRVTNVKSFDSVQKFSAPRLPHSSWSSFHYEVSASHCRTKSDKRCPWGFSWVSQSPMHMKWVGLVASKMSRFSVVALLGS